VNEDEFAPDTLISGCGIAVNKDRTVILPPEMTDQLERIERQLEAVIGMMVGAGMG
jgi:hypothetical protein